MSKKEGSYSLETIVVVLVIFIIIAIILDSLSIISALDPQGPDDISVVDNQTKSAPGAAIVNISGGYISTLILNATIQNPRWKAFIGNVTGLFTLDDSSGSTIYDWRLTSITGKVYTTRNSSSVTWASINCSNRSLLEQENVYINHSNVNDNLTATFNTSAGATHNAFTVGSLAIGANICPTLNTYVNNISQDNYFEEMALFDGASTVYATILQNKQTGYNGKLYDFQMIVPENGLATFTGATAYYLYVEIGT